MILPYETIFSRALSRIDDPKELALDSNDFVEIYTERLHLSLIHISEPTRRTPISYAVFCLKKKKTNK